MAGSYNSIILPVLGIIVIAVAGFILFHNYGMVELVQPPLSPANLTPAGNFTLATNVSAGISKSKIPSGILYFVPIVIKNAQSVGTASPFVQLVTVNSSRYMPFESRGLNNIEFFYSNGTIVNSWLENNNGNTSTASRYWLRIKELSPAGQSGNSITVYMGFAAPTTNLFNKINTGEAPNYSTTGLYTETVNGDPAYIYGQFDDGADVFTGYWNFSGTSLPSGWTKNGNPAITINNGVRFDSSSGSGYSGIQSATSYGAGNVLDVYGALYSPLSTSTPTTMGFGFGDNLTANYELIGNTGNPSVFSITEATKKTVESTSMDYVITQTNLVGVPTYGNQAIIWSEGYNSTSSYAQMGYGTLGPISKYVVNAAPTAPGKVQIVDEQQHVVFVYWARVRPAPPNGVMPKTSFQCVYSASTNSCSVPTLSFSSTPVFTTLSNIATAKAPSKSSKDTIEIKVNGAVEATGVGTATFNLDSLPSGSFPISVTDVNSLAIVNTQVNVYPYYDSIPIVLPGYETYANRFYPGSQIIQLPITSWNNSYPGIFYIDNASNLDEYTLSTRAVRVVAPYTVLWENLGYAGMQSNLFWIGGPNMDTAYSWGTLTNGGGNIYIETVNLTSGEKFLVNTGISVGQVSSNGDAHYITNNMFLLITQSGQMYLFNMSTGQKWTAGEVQGFEGNNNYYLYDRNVLIEPAADGATTETVDQLTLTSTNPNTEPQFNSSIITADSGVMSNYVNFQYDPAANAIFFLYGFDNGGGYATNGHKTPQIMLPFNQESGTLTTAGEVKYELFPPIYGGGNSASHRVMTGAYSWTNQPSLQSEPEVEGGISVIRATDPFNYTSPTVQQIPMSPLNYPLFNYSYQFAADPSPFYYKNTSYGIAPESVGMLASGQDQVIWFWNAALPQVPGGQTVK